MPQAEGAGRFGCWLRPFRGLQVATSSVPPMVLPLSVCVPESSVSPGFLFLY